MIQILIVDDHAILRRGLIQILQAGFPNAQFSEAASAAEALRITEDQNPDLIMLDITMPGCSGLEVLRALKAARCGAPVLVLSVHPADQFALRVLQAGASGYLNKDLAPEELVTAARKVLQGGFYVSDAIADDIMAALNPNAGRPPHEKLSDREFQVLRMIAEGQPVSRIGEALQLSVKTVSTYRARILEKMGLENNAEITRYAFEHHLVQ